MAKNTNQNKKSEGYAMLFLASLMISLSILIFTGNLYEDYEKKILIGVDIESLKKMIIFFEYQVFLHSNGYLRGAKSPAAR